MKRIYISPLRFSVVYLSFILLLDSRQRSLQVCERLDQKLLLSRKLCVVVLVILEAVQIGQLGGTAAEEKLGTYVSCIIYV